MACSSGAATVSEIVLGLAPGKVACTTTLGGTTSGYSLMGSCRIEINPMSTIRMESTPAKTGRRIKKCEKFMLTGGGLDGVGQLCGREFLGSHGHPGAYALQTVDDDLFSRLQIRTARRGGR